jgi:exopolysaccharide biosynthesis predicted pyruvyltransferase EpsI
MLILRKDELLLNDDNRKYIKDLAIKYFGNKVFVRDTNKFLIPFQSNRKNETFKFINDISGKKLIITDRLHGMIFSIITNTPCIIFGNNYHKIESSYYSWFKNKRAKDINNYRKKSKLTELYYYNKTKEEMMKNDMEQKYFGEEQK